MNMKRFSFGVVVGFFVAVLAVMIGACSAEQKAVERTILTGADQAVCLAADISGNSTADTVCTTVDKLSPIVSQLLQAKAKRNAAAADGGRVMTESRACVDMSLVDGLQVQQNGR